MGVLISGASGLIGTALKARLERDGVEVAVLVRRPSEADGVRRILWDPEEGRLDARALEGVDVVVHLAGENIASGRWTEARKKRILDSRVGSAALLCDALAGVEAAIRPKTLVSASAIGYYGDCGDALLDERSSPGQGFLAQVCRAWEQAVAPAAELGVRVVSPRIGIVLSGQGGALRRMLTPFRFGLGGVLGPGTQWISWISLEDLVSVLVRCLDDATLRGPVNAVAPAPVTNREFTRALARTLRRPALTPMPAPLVSLLFGEMGRELLLSSTRVIPRRLEEIGFSWHHRDICAALSSCINTPHLKDDAPLS